LWEKVVFKGDTARKSGLHKKKKKGQALRQEIPLSDERTMMIQGKVEGGV